MPARRGRQWGRLAIVLLLAAITALFVFGVTLSTIIDSRMPDLALRAYPLNATAHAAKAASLMAPDMPPATKEKVRSLAEAALRLDPTSVIAARSLGLLADTRGDQADAARMRAYSLYLSRRDVPTQFWAIEEAVGRNDIPAALTHYNEALLTSATAERLLLPILVIASEQEHIRTPLLTMLSARPLWWGAFVRELFTTGTSRQMIVAVFRRLHLDRPDTDPMARELAGLGLSRLIALGDYGDAWALAGHAEQANLRNGGFERSITPPPFGWQLANDMDLSAAIQPGGTGRTGYALFPSASGGRSGDVATQLVVLPPGRYVLSARASGAFPAGSALTMRCHKTDAVLGTVAFPAHATGGRVSTGFVVPANDCAGQVIAIRMASGDGDGDVAPADQNWIDDVTLVPEVS